MKEGPVYQQHAEVFLRQPRRDRVNSDSLFLNARRPGLPKQLSNVGPRQRLESWGYRVLEVVSLCSMYKYTYKYIEYRHQRWSSLDVGVLPTHNTVYI